MTEQEYLDYYLANDEKMAYFILLRMLSDTEVKYTWEALQEITILEWKAKE